MPYQVCPVCNGTGKRPSSFYPSEWPYDNTATITVSSGHVLCRSCGGHGVLWEAPPCSPTYWSLYSQVKIPGEAGEDDA